MKKYCYQKYRIHLVKRTIPPPPKLVHYYLVNAFLGKTPAGSVFAKVFLSPDGFFLRILTSCFSDI